MKKSALALLTVVLVLIVVGPSGAQEVKHAPTVEQCQADQRLWLSKLETTGDVSANYDEISGWAREMGECMSVDPEFRSRYSHVAYEIMAEQSMRLEAFLTRHNLWQQFTAEDAQGKRH